MANPDYPDDPYAPDQRSPPQCNPGYHPEQNSSGKWQCFKDDAQPQSQDPPLGCPPGYYQKDTKSPCIPDTFEGKEQPSKTPAVGYAPTSSLSRGVARPDLDIYNFYSQRTPQEQQALQAISDFARLLGGYGQNLYGVGMPAYTAALQYYNSILGGSKGAATAAVAPQAEQIAEVYRGAQTELEGMPRGGVRDAALAKLTQGKAGAIGQLIPLAQQDAAGKAGALGLSGAQTGMGGVESAAGLNAGIVNAEQSNRQSAAALEQQNRFGAASLFLQDKGLDLQRLLGLRGQDIQKELGYAGIEASASAQNAALAQANAQFQQTFGFQQQYFDWYRQFQQQQLDYGRQQAKGSKYGGLLGGLLGLGGSLGSAAIMTSDARTKTDVVPHEAGLAAVRKLRPVAFTYNGFAGTPAGARRVGLVADELEKVIPAAVPRASLNVAQLLGSEEATRLVDPMPVLVTLVNAVQELDSTVAKLLGRRAAPKKERALLA